MVWWRGDEAGVQILGRGEETLCMRFVLSVLMTSELSQSSKKRSVLIVRCECTAHSRKDGSEKAYKLTRDGEAPNDASDACLFKLRRKSRLSENQGIRCILLDVVSIS